ncbi:Uncharacterized protein PECH_002227 [Penicillium ucsense]|uniref:Uncharacterized protein n=1 Tax=Penicillium ucsense TaxID=2839758 RepID=A0A8J8VZB9_9EURO|nr:Uncharacterized protein PECM_001396 [Penicillium ucsense]KAF7731145.1 Uncharacterized protein PECH_002227 [Penicillium ucsense]
MARSDELPQHGRKRHADSDPDGAQPLAKRFGYLHIGNPFDTLPRDHLDGLNGNSPSRTSAALNSPPSSVAADTSDYGHSTFSSTSLASTSTPSNGAFIDSDAMMLDDTPHTTYIHDLDRELADVDVADGLFSIHPIAAKMLSVPESVLSGPAQGKELVLYSDPSSLTVPREHDNVRKAIIESRARARERTRESQTVIDCPMSSLTNDDSVNSREPTKNDTQFADDGDDGDAMEVDLIS